MLDAIIVGGGPAGLSAALILGRARRDVLLIDGGHGRNAPASAVHGLLTRDGVPPAELRELARAEIARYPSVQVRDSDVASVTGSCGSFTVDGERGRRVLLATGVRDDLPDIDGLGEQWGRTVFHCPYCHGFELCGEPMAVLAVEPGDVSMAAKLRCYGQVTVCTNGTVDVDNALLERLGIAVRMEPILRLEPRCVTFDAGDPLETGAVFVPGSTRQASELPAALGCRFLDDGSIEVDDMQLTSVPGVYAAGDIARRASAPLPGAMVSLAAAAGTMAGVAIDQDLLAESCSPPAPA